MKKLILFGIGSLLSTQIAFAQANGPVIKGAAPVVPGVPCQGTCSPHITDSQVIDKPQLSPWPGYEGAMPGGSTVVPGAQPATGADQPDAG
ncbi:MAG: hypothetical protein ACAH59_08410 [Pseudobdellovibrionaceae bacterium]